MIGANLPTYTNIVIRVLTEIDMLLNNYVFNGYSALSGYMKIPLGIIATLYIVILGYGVMMGWVRLSMNNFVKAVLKIGLIYMAVTEWGWISQNLIGLVNNAIGGIGDALISASPIHIPGADGINGAMQIVLIQFTKIGGMIFNTGGWSNFGGWLEGIVVWGFGYLMIGLSLFEIILSKVMLAILFVFIPVIVVFCYFKNFQSIFDRWLGAIIGFALLQLFVTAALTLALSLAYWWEAANMGFQAIQIGNYGTLPIVIIGIICIGIIFKAADLAQNLGGTVTTASASAMLGGMIGGAVGSTMSGLNLMRSGAGLGGSFLGLGKGVLGLNRVGKNFGMAEKTEKTEKTVSDSASAMKDINSRIKSGE